MLLIHELALRYLTFYTRFCAMMTSHKVLSFYSGTKLMYFGQ